MQPSEEAAAAAADEACRAARRPFVRRRVGGWLDEVAAPAGGVAGLAFALAGLEGWLSVQRHQPPSPSRPQSSSTDASSPSPSASPQPPSASPLPTAAVGAAEIAQHVGFFDEKALDSGGQERLAFALRFALANALPSFVGHSLSAQVVLQQRHRRGVGEITSDKAKGALKRPRLPSASLSSAAASLSPSSPSPLSPSSRVSDTPTGRAAVDKDGAVGTLGAASSSPPVCTAPSTAAGEAIKRGLPSPSAVPLPRPSPAVASASPTSLVSLQLHARGGVLPSSLRALRVGLATGTALTIAAGSLVAWRRGQDEYRESVLSGVTAPTPSTLGVSTGVALRLCSQQGLHSHLRSCRAQGGRGEVPRVPVVMFVEGENGSGHGVGPGMLPPLTRLMIEEESVGDWRRRGSSRGEYPGAGDEDGGGAPPSKDGHHHQQQHQQQQPLALSLPAPVWCNLGHQISRGAPGERSSLRLRAEDGWALPVAATPPESWRGGEDAKAGNSNSESESDGGGMLLVEADAVSSTAPQQLMGREAHHRWKPAWHRQQQQRLSVDQAIWGGVMLGDAAQQEYQRQERERTSSSSNNSSSGSSSGSGAGKGGGEKPRPMQVVRVLLADLPTSAEMEQGQGGGRMGGIWAKVVEIAKRVSPVSRGDGQNIEGGGQGERGGGGGREGATAECGREALDDMVGADVVINVRAAMLSSILAWAEEAHTSNLSDVHATVEAIEALERAADAERAREKEEERADAELAVEAAETEEVLAEAEEASRAAMEALAAAEGVAVQGAAAAAAAPPAAAAAGAAAAAPSGMGEAHEAATEEVASSVPRDGHNEGELEDSGEGSLQRQRGSNGSHSEDSSASEEEEGALGAPGGEEEETRWKATVQRVGAGDGGALSPVLNYMGLVGSSIRHSANVGGHWVSRWWSGRRSGQGEEGGVITIEEGEGNLEGGVGEVPKDGVEERVFWRQAENEWGADEEGEEEQEEEELDDGAFEGEMVLLEQEAELLLLEEQRQQQDQGTSEARLSERERRRQQASDRRRQLLSSLRERLESPNKVLMYDTDDEESFAWLRSKLNKQGWTVERMEGGGSMSSGQVHGGSVGRAESSSGAGGAGGAGGGGGGAAAEVGVAAEEAAVAAVTASPVLVHYSSDERTLSVSAKHLARAERAAVSSSSPSSSSSSGSCVMPPHQLQTCSVVHSIDAREMMGIVSFGWKDAQVRTRKGVTTRPSTPQQADGAAPGESRRGSGKVVCTPELGEELFEFARERLQRGVAPAALQQEIDAALGDL